MRFYIFILQQNGKYSRCGMTILALSKASAFELAQKLYPDATIKVKPYYQVIR